jgi:hypothetical protein
MGKKIRSAYESALERMGLSDTTAEASALTDTQKGELAEIDRVYEAKAAERKILAESETARLMKFGKLDEAAKVRNKLAVTLGELEEEKKREKEKVRSRKR